MLNILYYALQNEETRLQMFLTILVTNCSSEWLFSSLKGIKNRLRLALGQQKINAFGNIINQYIYITANLSFDYITNVFRTKSEEKIVNILIKFDLKAMKYKSY